MPPLIIVFAKAPREGAVKTRMTPLLGARHAAGLHQAMVRDTLESLRTIERECVLELHTDIETDAWKDVFVSRKMQVEGDLGLRMWSAMRDGLRRGHSRVLIAGSDAPTLPSAYLRELLESTADVALGPTEDGGYYAIACSRTHPAMFCEVEWSTARALGQTMTAAKACGLTVELGRPWFDVDEPADLQRITGQGGAPHTRAFLESLQRETKE